MLSVRRAGATVTGIRVGQHPDKVRIVFDVTAKTNYRADLDNGENIVAHVPNTGSMKTCWDGTRFDATYAQNQNWWE